MITNNWVFLLYIISFTVGMASFLFALLYYIQERISWFVYYLAFLFVFGMLILIHFMGLYDLFIMVDSKYSRIFNTLLIFSLTLAMGLLLYIIPIFLFHVIKFRDRTFKIMLATTTSSLYFIFSIINILSEMKLFQVVALTVLFIALCINIIIGARHIKNVNDNILRNLILALGILTIIFLPVFIFDIYCSIVGFNVGVNVLNITIAFIYLWWNSIMLGYFFWYFIRTAANRNVIKQTEAETTVKKTTLSEKGFVLTKRETEIVSYILKGKSNKDIANALHISLNTVNNHVANIYEKTNVKNRVELVNVIKE